MTTNPRPALFGELLFDCFEDGSRVLGGAPFNVAWHLQAFHCQPLLISRVGDDEMGQQIRDTLQRWGMNSAGLQLDPEHPTGEVLVSLIEGQPHFDIVQDRAWDYIESSLLPPMAPALIYHGSLGLRNPVARTSFETLTQKHPAPLFVDVNLRPPWWGADSVHAMLAQARWLKINDHELETLVKVGDTLEEKALALLTGNEIEQIIVTQGERGAFCLASDGAIHTVRPAETVSVVDTVGAGDAFAAVCILALLNHWDIPTMLQRAQQFASKIVGQRGATAESPDLYRTLLQQWGL